MDLESATRFIKNLIKTWENGSVSSLSDFYQHSFKGTFLNTSVDINDLEQGFTYLQSRYTSIENKLVSIQQINKNQFLILSYFFALDNVLNQYAELYLTNVITFHDDKVHSIYSHSTRGINPLTLKAESNEDLTINSRHKKQFFMQLTHISQRKSTTLSSRELETLYYYLFGKTAKEIGRLLDLSFRTVETHISNIKNKFGVSTKTALMQIFNIG